MGSAAIIDSEKLAAKLSGQSKTEHEVRSIFIPNSQSPGSEVTYLETFTRTQNLNTTLYALRTSFAI